ncbi:Hypothetical predicted protein [Mytilus galloprovincialis]|uniref:Uncharacterized protein n=1 Tax=Mytilus galloprovincialis TaxID=29158 RepID=A0A8B6DY73_MYTGA|nr:Hypothetical predicted protein [Mytilus galloprovincialis]
MQILCPRNEIIEILDVWENSIHACPAYNNTHQSNTSYVHYNCDGKHSCTIPTHNGRKHIDCLQSKRNVPYESTTVRETNDRQYTNIELSPDTKHDKSDDGQFMGNTRQMYENAAHMMDAHAREKYYVSDLKQNVDYKQ